jgi:hypothetical protein
VRILPKRERMIAKVEFKMGDGDKWVVKGERTVIKNIHTKEVKLRDLKEHIQYAGKGKR